MLLPLIVTLIAVACAGLNLALAWNLKARAKHLRKLSGEIQALRAEQEAAVARANALAADPPLELMPYERIAAEFWRRQCCGIAITHRHGAPGADIRVCRLSVPTAMDFLAHAGMQLAAGQITRVKSVEELASGPAATLDDREPPKPRPGGAPGDHKP